MKIFLFLVMISFAVYPASGQQHHQQRAKVVQELTALFANLNEAIQKHDRAALEKIYADEFLFIHGFGYIDTKTDQINGFMETDSIMPLRIPSFDQLFIYDDVAVLRAMNRNPVAGNNLMSTTIYAKKDGQWRIVQVQSTQQQKERNIVKVGSRVLDTYVGSYQQGGSLITVTKQNDSLFVQRRGRPKLHVASTADTVFFDKFGSMITFRRNEDGKVTHLVHRSQNGQEVIWRKD